MAKSGQTRITPHNKRRLIATRPRRKLFGERRQRRFLESLAATCNVTESAKAAGVVVNTVYNCRMKSPAFRAAWEQALEQGYARLEAAMLAQAAAAIDFDGGKEAPGRLDWDRAADLLDKYERRRTRRRDEAPRFAAVPVEEARARLIAKLKAIGALKS
jgi:hypothetical protein